MAIIPWEKFEQVTGRLVRKLKQMELANPEEWSGMRQADLIKWYINKYVAAEASGDTELATETKIVNAIITRLVSKDMILLCTLPDPDPQQRYLTVHPNYVLNQ